VAAADGVLFACPEYNGSVTGPLKNAIDWASRHPNNAWAGKPVAMMGAGGGSGTAKAQLHLRDIAVVVDALVLNKSVQVQARRTVIRCLFVAVVYLLRPRFAAGCCRARADARAGAQAFTPGNCDLATGELTSADARKRVADLVAALAAWVRQLAPK